MQRSDDGVTEREEENDREAEDSSQKAWHSRIDRFPSRQNPKPNATHCSVSCQQRVLSIRTDSHQARVYIFSSTVFSHDEVYQMWCSVKAGTMNCPSWLLPKFGWAVTTWYHTRDSRSHCREMCWRTVCNALSIAIGLGLGLGRNDRFCTLVNVLILQSFVQGVQRVHFTLYGKVQKVDGRYKNTLSKPYKITSCTWCCQVGAFRSLQQGVRPTSTPFHWTTAKHVGET